MESENSYCKAIQNRMKERGYSLRCLARKSGISPATVSRILNGRQGASVKQIGEIANALKIPVAELLEGTKAAEEAKAAEETKADEEAKAGEETREDLLFSLFRQANITDRNELEEKVISKLRQYEEYALTEDGQEMIYTEFEGKVNSVRGSGVFIEELKLLYELLKAGGLTKQAYMMIGGALLYFIIPMDIIPDYLFGMGYLDDLMVIQSVFRSLKL